MTARTDGHGAPSAAPPPAAGPSSPDVARLRLLIARLYRQMAQASGDDLNLTYAQLSALARIEEQGPMRLGELAAYERVAAPSATRTVGPLAAAGLIRKEPDPSDGRSWLVSIAPAGTDLLVRIRRERSELLARRMSRLTPDQGRTLRAALPVLEQLLTEPED
ncbi:transcriptional regulator, MarR family [Streptomyces sp. DvalAA-14]|uniref:MarR family winged helix-turn-helix transcriptional regulator n=1 Tax=unclassified Streptomyces TaxID=2593676 RepID=UPI00081B82C5|nr:MULTISPECIES: MarR family transcriptional regulator [unclassified Streptomyces]MYS23444.1 MarR family transcriptional regulator [Streptomyces sp. SID4948]SCE33326.1 transcriptional regulator, MarR family [Streptomyces sp. DvalAA-14]